MSDSSKRAMEVLIAEDDAVARRMLEAMLVKWGYEVVVTCDGTEAWQVLRREDAPQLAILDWMMPDVDGVEVCRKLRGRTNAPYVYVLMLTVKDRKEDLIQGMDAGADDYLTKPFDAHELRVRLRAGQRILDLQRALLASQEAFRHQATHDALTGVWNHGEIMGILDHELNRASRQETPVAVIMSDLDHFKEVNDTYGHLAGDAVLREVSHRMSDSVRSYDAIGRYGGEEFLVVLPACDASGASGLAERIRTHVGGEAIETPQERISVTISLGVTTSEKKGKVDAEALVQTADEALYRAKRAGRNRVELATEEGGPS